MQKVYSLLRNNKQTGPYTLQELVQLSLKPTDLVWVEGKSAGWSYPSEIESLRPYTMEDTPVQEEVLREAATPKSLLNTKTSLETNTSESKSTGTTHIFISFPSGNQNTFTRHEFPIVSSSDEESPEAKLERKAQELRTKIQAFAANKQEAKNSNDPDIKYTRSLDDIKEEYSDWLHQQKKEKDFPVKKATLFALPVLLLTVGGYFLSKQILQPNSVNAGQIAVRFTEVPSAKDLDAEAMPAREEPQKNRSEKTARTNAASKNLTSFPEFNKVDAFIDSLKNAEKEMKEAVVARHSTEKERATKYEEEPGVQEQSRKTEPVTQEATASLPDLIELSEKNLDKGKELTVYNNSNKHLKFVAVDVFFYKTNEKLLERKTIYFNDVPPGSISRRMLPGHRKANSVRYQMGLISTDGGIFYAKQ